MKKFFIYIIILAVGLAIVKLFFLKTQKNIAIKLPSPKINLEKPIRVILPVPYINEAPDKILKEPWINACEEASVAMVEKYYLGENFVSISDAKSFMMILFDAQDKLYGSNKNSDADRTAKLINNYSSFKATVKERPTRDKIKEELRQKRPVITFHRGFDLQNKNIPFSPNGSSYHSLVIIGYDDATREFITNDPGDIVEGKSRRYDYDLLINSLRDYNYSDKKADGPARVIFTAKDPFDVNQ